MGRRARTSAGTWGAVVGAMVMNAVAVVAAGQTGGWAALKCPAFPFAMHPGFNLPVLIASQISHLLVSIAWGILFGLRFAGRRRSVVLLGGVLWGLVVLIGMYFVVLPAFGMFDYVRQSNPLYAVATHIGYGVGLGLGTASLLEDRRSTLTGRPRLHFWTPARARAAQA
jgi:hypothetical protein